MPRLPVSVKRAMTQPRPLIKALMLCLLLSAPLARGDAYKLETVAAGLQEPWSVARLPDGSFLVTLRPGRLIHVDRDGGQREIRGTPDTYYAGQGGFFDLVLHPGSESNRDAKGKRHRGATRALRR